MLNSPDWKITNIVMNCRYSAPEDPFAVQVKFQQRGSTKTALALYAGEKAYLEVAAQAKRQIALREHVTVTDEPKPIVRKEVAPAVVIKGKGKKKS